MATQRKKPTVNRAHAPNHSGAPVSDVTSLKRRRLDELLNYRNTLGDKNVRDLLSQPGTDDFFCAIVELAIRDYGVQQNHLAKYLGISPSTVGRWADGLALPPIYAREKVAEAILELITVEIEGRKESFLIA